MSMSFSDADLKRLKEQTIGVSPHVRPWVTPGEIFALLARLEAHEELDPYLQHSQLCTFWMSKTSCSCGLWVKQEAWRKVAGK